MIESLWSAVGVEQRWKRSYESVIELLHGEQQRVDRLRDELKVKDNTIAALRTKRESAKNVVEQAASGVLKTPTRQIHGNDCVLKY
jgi:hypothetical protein